MPPKARPGAAGRAQRMQNTQAAELNLDTAGASDALVAVLCRLGTASAQMRRDRRVSIGGGARRS